MDKKSVYAKREEKVLVFWKEKGIFEKSLNKWPAGKAPKGEFIFYEGPPTANGHPGIHHLEARAFKDAIPRYKTMRGYHVRRKGGWDTHGLPVEIQVEKELGLKSKKEVESYGIAKFNDKCKESVWKFVHEWEEFTDRIGYWIDLKKPYITYKPEYIESLWNIVKKVDDDGLLYKDYKVVPWCPRCGTALSSHELAQGYEDVKDLAVTVKFKVKVGQKIGDFMSDDNTFILAWTTTPWTLPGNVALAVGAKIDYVRVRLIEDVSDKILPEVYFIAKDRLTFMPIPQGHHAFVEVNSQLKGYNIVNLQYEPLYPFLSDNISGEEKKKLGNAFKVCGADFVTTDDGTGIVHTAVMYGQDDFVLGGKVGLPKYHLVNEDGTFKKEAGFLAGAFVKDEKTDVAIIKDLASRKLLFAKEKYEHNYPFCWRCHTPLIYYARDSWYIAMSKLRDVLVKENEGIHWEPEHIKEGRFGEWLREVKDWAISRERYWGTPLPVWSCDKCGKRRVVGSVEEIKQKPRNTYFVMRHGEAENNVAGILDDDPKERYHLTEAGRQQVEKAADIFKEALPDIIFTSPLTRTQETAEILRGKLGLDKSRVITDERLHELGFGDWDRKNGAGFADSYPFQQRFEIMPLRGELYGSIKNRVGDFLYEIESKYQGKKILIITHGTPAVMLLAVAKGLDRAGSIEYEMNEYLDKAEVRKIDFSILPHNAEYELDLHRPFIDEVKLKCECGGEMSRVKEVMDVWFDSGAMPFAQDHYPFENKEYIDGAPGENQSKSYPADFISEAIDQTRGWFYTLHAVGTLMGKGKAYRNVVCLGHLLDAKGKKMSKHIGNVVNPWEMMEKYGVDALRFWMYSINQAGDSKNFDEKTVDETVKKVFNLAGNVLAFYKLYTGGITNNQETITKTASKNVLDAWIVSRMNWLIENVTKNLDDYLFFEPTRAIRDFVGDLSQWYLRRSRDRFKEDGKSREEALNTTKYILITLAKIMAPFTPFFADYLYQEAGGQLESVHLEEWPHYAEASRGKPDTGEHKLLDDMEEVRRIASKGLEARMAAKINVRQPLAKLKVKNSNGKSNKKSEALNEELLRLIRDEVNVKEVVFDDSIAGEVELDTNITPELKEEGDLRELIRKIQDLRKEKGLTVGDIAVLEVTKDLEGLVKKYGNELKKATGLRAIEVGESFGLKE
ncbi:class I tRNA ligase family protein [Patescibacteria group bacterium]|nr:class I tRNA ligase family protein [Patescibacteria group bacterium]MDE1946418.1 class I tRNA ligase family protein [Patescibacteria group bacterium]MDE2011027.1 class I tRNA ligase family protein [Patescibacteria group bacterium]MDE2233476.1 class I tRNA ligase family protein [Patescibacteria group bacterium]